MVLISHRYKFIYFKNYKTASTPVETFFAQFCIDPALQSSYDFNDRMEESITPYGIISERNTIYDKNGSSLVTPDMMIYLTKLKAYRRYKNVLHDPTTSNTAIPNSEIMWYNYKDALNVMEDLGENMFTQYTKFCVVRNPYDVIVSSYHYSIDIIKESEVSFKDYCKYFCKNINTMQLTITDKSHMNDHSRIFMNDMPVCDYYIRYENLKEDIEIVLQKLGIIEYNLNDLPRHRQRNYPENTPYQLFYDDETRELVYTHYKKIIEYFGYTF